MKHDDAVYLRHILKVQVTTILAETSGGAPGDIC